MLYCKSCGGAPTFRIKDAEQYGASCVYIECMRCRRKTKSYGITEVVMLPDGSGIVTPVTGSSLVTGLLLAAHAWGGEQAAAGGDD